MYVCTEIVEWLCSCSINNPYNSNNIRIFRGECLDEDEPAPEAILRRRLTIATAEDHIPDDVEELPLLDDDGWRYEFNDIELRPAEVASKSFEVDPVTWEPFIS